MLQRNIASLCAQTDEDWEQTLLVDTEGRGVPAAQRALAAHAPYLQGDYVWVLDDDDECIRPELVAELKAIAKAHSPNVIMLRMDHGERGVLPNVGWHGKPEQGDIGCSAFVVDCVTWWACSTAWGEQYDGDFEFISEVLSTDPDIYWHDVIASRCQRISHGEPE